MSLYNSINTPSYTNELQPTCTTKTFTDLVKIIGPPPSGKPTQRARGDGDRGVDDGAGTGQQTQRAHPRGVHGHAGAEVDAFKVKRGHFRPAQRHVHHPVVDVVLPGVAVGGAIRVFVAVHVRFDVAAPVRQSHGQGRGVDAQRAAVEFQRPHRLGRKRGKPQHVATRVRSLGKFVGPDQPIFKIVKHVGAVTFATVEGAFEEIQPCLRDVVVDFGPVAPVRVLAPLVVAVAFGVVLAHHFVATHVVVQLIGHFRRSSVVLETTAAGPFKLRVRVTVARKDWFGDVVGEGGAAVQEEEEEEGRCVEGKAHGFRCGTHAQGVFLFGSTAD